MTTSDTFLINEDLLKLYSVMSRNVGIDKIVPFINLAQPMEIETILGDALSEELKLQINSDTLTELNKALLVKIAPALALWTDFYALRSMAWTVTQKGITREHSENSEALNKEELAYYQESLRENAETATELLIRYLCKCAEEYPLWKPSDDCLCNKYNKENNGKAQKPVTSLIYFPSGSLQHCPCECKH